jgi:hypothetical protein
VIPDAVVQSPEIGAPVLMVAVGRSTMPLARVAAKFTGYRELFRRQVRDDEPARARGTGPWRGREDSARALALKRMGDW